MYCRNSLKQSCIPILYNTCIWISPAGTNSANSLTATINRNISSMDMFLCYPLQHGNHAQLFKLALNYCRCGHKEHFGRNKKRIYVLPTITIQWVWIKYVYKISHEEKYFSKSVNYFHFHSMLFFLIFATDSSWIYFL